MKCILRIDTRMLSRLIKHGAHQETHVVNSKPVFNRITRQLADGLYHEKFVFVLMGSLPYRGGIHVVCVSL